MSWYSYYHRSSQTVPITIQGDVEPFAEQPKECRNLRLYPFQLQSLYRMQSIEANPRRKIPKPQASTVATASNAMTSSTWTSHETAIGSCGGTMDSDDESTAIDCKMLITNGNSGTSSNSNDLGCSSSACVIGNSSSQHVSGGAIANGGLASNDDHDEDSDEENADNHNNNENNEDDDENDEVESRVGILANKPGSGKSAIILSLCSQPCGSKNQLSSQKGDLYHLKISNHDKTYRKNKVEVRTNLIICNPKLLLQWSGYMKNFDYPAYVITNKTKVPKTMKEFIDLCHMNRVIFLSSAALSLLADIRDDVPNRFGYRQSADVFDCIWFDRIIIDEIDSMEFPKCSRINFHCNFIWWVSATPLSFLSNVGTNRRGVGAHFKEYLVTMTCFHEYSKDKDVLSLFTIRCDDKEIDDCIALPPYTIVDIFVPPSAALRLTQGIIENNQFQNMLRGDRLDQAISLLSGVGCNAGDGTSIATLAEAATAWMDTMISNLRNEKEYVEHLIITNMGTSSNQTLTAEEQRRQKRLQDLIKELGETERKKALLLERIAQSTDCMICCDVLINPVATKCCTQAFCLECMKSWLLVKRSCPNCRSAIDERKDFLVKAPPKPAADANVTVGASGSATTAVGVSSAKGSAKTSSKAGAKKRKASEISSSDEVATGGSSSASASSTAITTTRRETPRTKIAALLQVLETSQRSLVYIECIGDDTTGRIRAALEENGIKVLSLAGHTASTCMKFIDQLREAKTKTCLMVSSIQHSAGFNLQFVDTIVMYQRMGDRETQIIGRGMRAGRTEPLKVYRILYQTAE